MALGIQCPAAFASPPQPLVVGLRHLSDGSPAPTFEVECVSLVHSFVVGISAERGARLPLLYLTQPIGETDEFGIAHVLLQASDQEQISLTLDTSARPELRPQSPSLTFVTAPRDELVLLTQRFVEERRPRPRLLPRQIPREILH